MERHTFLLDNGHGRNTKGKCSPDQSFFEWEYTRQVVAGIAEHFQNEPNLDVVIVTPEETDISLTERANRVNKVVNENPKDTTFLISIHVNAAGSGGAWTEATGWQSHCCRSASKDSRKLANCLWDACSELGLKGRRPLPTQNYWENDFTILKKTLCPAVLTENFFMDNRKDIQWLVSPEGFETIVNLHVAGIYKYLDWGYSIITEPA